MSFWDKVKKDLQKGIREGVTVVKEGAVVVKQKAGELTEEGKKRYKAFGLKSKVQKEIAELGGKIYDLREKAKNPLLDSTVKTIISKVGKLEAQIETLEGKPKVAAKKTAKQTVAKRTAKARGK